MRLFRLAQKNLANFAPWHHALDVAALCQLLSRYADEIVASDYTINPWSPETAPKLKLRSGRGGSPEPPGRLKAIALPREDQFDSRNNQHRRETKRNYADRKTPAPQMRADNAANNCRRCENESERRDGANFCEVANQPGDRVHPDEQRRDSGGLSNVSPATKQQDRREKIPPPVPVNPARNPSAAPTLIATGRDGGDVCGGSLRRTSSRAAENSSTTPMRIFRTEADGCK